MILRIDLVQTHSNSFCIAWSQDNTVINCFVSSSNFDITDQKYDKFIDDMKTFKITQIQVATSEVCLNFPFQRQAAGVHIAQILSGVAKSQRFVTNLSIVHSIMIPQLIDALTTECKWEFLNQIDLTSSSIHWRNLSALLENRCQYLNKLILVRNNINDDGARQIARKEMKNLRYLDLTANPIGNKGVKALCKAQWPKLQYLSLQQIHATTHILNYLQKIQDKETKTLLLHYNISPNNDYEKMAKMGFKFSQVTKIIFYRLDEFITEDRLKNINAVSKRQNLQQSFRKVQEQEGITKKQNEYQILQYGLNFNNQELKFVKQRLRDIYIMHCEDSE